VLINQLFDPKYNMFIQYKDSQLFWFNGITDQSNEKFELIGKLMALALFNDAILNINMPIAFHKKLQGMNPTLEVNYFN
jgi:HECT-domain (ubiquitin-transferase)